MTAEVPVDEMVECWLRYHPDDVQCDGCGLVYKWDKLPHENVNTQYESRGEYWGAPAYEEVVTGWECPGCGHHNPV
jgi:rubredoxin